MLALRDGPLGKCLMNEVNVPLKGTGQRDLLASLSCEHTSGSLQVRRNLSPFQTSGLLHLGFLTSASMRNKYLLCLNYPICVFGLYGFFENEEDIISLHFY